MALNDPQWGKKNNDGPPDLDEIWRRFRRRLNDLLAGRGGPRGPQGSGGMRQFGNGMWIVAVVLILVWIASGFYIVDEGRRGVVTRFGKYQETTMPGPRMHLPVPIESAEVVDVSRVRTVEVGYHGNAKNKVPQESLMLTDDENIIDIQFAVQYTIHQPKDFLFNNRNPEDAVKQAAETAIRQVVGKHKMDFVLYEGRSEIASSAATLTQQILDGYRTGIFVSQVTMQNAQPPEQVQAAFDDAVKAGQDKERQKNEGQAYANDVIPRARGKASRMLEEASGYGQRVAAAAEGDVSRFDQILAEYDKAPDVMRTRMYLDTMQQILANTSKVLVDQKPGSGNLMYLPLDKLLTQSSATGAAAAEPDTPAKPAAAEPAAQDSNTRSRDAFRSRDREPR